MEGVKRKCNRYENNTSDMKSETNICKDSVLCFPGTYAVNKPLSLETTIAYFFTIVKLAL